MSVDPVTFQIIFYLASPVITFLAVATAYLALYRQSKPNVIAASFSTKKDEEK